MNRNLRSLFLTVILDSRFISLKRTLAELRRKLTFKTRVVHVFLQLDDPYSYLLSHYLEFVSRRYKKVEFRFYLCQALSGEFMPQPGMLADYAVNDCKLLAQEFGVPFLDMGDAPAVEYRRPLIDFLADQLGSHFYEPIRIPAGKSPLNDDVLPFDVSKLAQTLPEYLKVGPHPGSI